MKKFKIKANDEGRTVLKFLEKMMTDVPKHRIEKLFRNKDIKINNERIKDKKIILKFGDEVLVYGVEFETKLVKARPIQKRFNVVYEDEFVLIVDKEPGVIMSDVPNSLDQQIMNYLNFQQVDSFVPSSIGRLDKVTSGLVIYAKDYKTLRELKEKQKQFEKIYLFKSDLPKPITTTYKIEHDEERKREVAGEFGKSSKTEFYFDKTKKFAKLHTGRKHQIRVSLSKLGYPIYGDRKYGGKHAERVFLHCYSLKLRGLSNRLKKINGLAVVKDPYWN